MFLKVIWGDFKLLKKITERFRDAGKDNNINISGIIEMFESYKNWVITPNYR